MLRVRFAPSPTGYLHIGNARTALFNYLLAKQKGGAFILRIEDTDKERSKKEYITQICEDLAWLGLEWSEGPDVGGDYGPYLQSERSDMYNEYIQKLIAEGKAYYCYCTAEELENRRKSQLAQGQSLRYDNRCRDLSVALLKQYQTEGRKPSIRFRMPDKNIIVKDVIRGDVVRPDGVPKFHLAVCVDDGLMNITHVIRGEDHLSNTPRHVALFEACGFTVPSFAHMPLTMGPGGEPLSKRFGAMSISDYRKMGYLPQAVCNYIALLGWASGNDKEIYTFEELIQAFSLKRVSRSAAIFDRTKMNWLSGEHIRMLSDSDYVKKSVQYLLQEKIVDRSLFVKRPEWYEKVLMVFKHNIHSFEELEDRLKIFSDEYEIENKEIVQTETAQLILTELAKMLKTFEKVDEDNFNKIFKDLKKRVKVKGKELFMPVRVALSGREHGPEIKHMIVLLGKNNCLDRIEKALSLHSAQ